MANCICMSLKRAVPVRNFRSVRDLHQCKPPVHVSRAECISRKHVVLSAVPRGTDLGVKPTCSCFVSYYPSQRIMTCWSIARCAYRPDGDVLRRKANVTVIKVLSFPRLNISNVLSVFNLWRPYAIYHGQTSSLGDYCRYRGGELRIMGSGWERITAYFENMTCSTRSASGRAVVNHVLKNWQGWDLSSVTGFHLRCFLFGLNLTLSPVGEPNKSWKSFLVKNAFFVIFNILWCKNLRTTDRALNFW